MSQIKWDPGFENSMRKIARQKLATAAKETAHHVREKLSRGRRGSVGDFRSVMGAGEPPHVDTGRLRQSIFWDYVDDSTVLIGTPLLYGLYMELGAFVRPKHGKRLAIPWSTEAKRWSAMGNGARSFALTYNLVSIQSKHGAILLVDTGGPRARKFVIHWILVDHATIPPHPYLRPSLDEMMPRIQAIFNGET